MGDVVWAFISTADEDATREVLRVLGALFVGCRPGIVETAFSVDDEPRALAALGMSKVVGAFD